MAKTKGRAGKRAGTAGRSGLRALKSGGSKARKPGLSTPKSAKTGPRKEKPSVPSETARLKRLLKAARLQQQKSASEVREALERQTATAEVLQVISSSPGDLKPVFDRMLAKAMRLCEAQCGFIYQMEQGAMRAVAEIGVPPAFAEYRLKNLHTGGAATPADVMRATRKPAHVHDARESEPYRSGNPNAVAGVDLGGARTVLYVPMISNDDIVGVINVYRQEVKPFTDEQISLLENFASQAVIAIENARLFNEVQAKTRDLTESLQHQTATADVLKVISRSVFDLQAVLDTLVESAYQLCGANLSLLYLKAGEAFECEAIAGPGVEEASRYFKGRPIRAGRATSAERVIMTGGVQSVTDFFADPEFDPNAKEIIRNAGNSGLGLLRSTLAVPMMRDNAVIGVLVIASPQTGPFPSRQVELLQTFADQAVIAIENVRLFNETQEALERQTATAEILKVIASSPTNVQPVFEAIAESAKHLIGGQSAIVTRVVDDQVHLVAFTKRSEAGDRELQSSYPIALTSPLVQSKVARTGEYIVRTDIDAEPPSKMKELARARGYRSSISIPMLRDGISIGTISITRKDPGPFSKSEIDLVKTFADQAVIAIENVRLFDEVQAKTRDLTEALEQQTATSEILQVISSSQGELDPVFTKLLENATRVCGASFGTMNLYENGEFRQVARYNVPNYSGVRPEVIRPHPGSGLATVARTRRVVQIEDIRTSAPYREGAPEVQFLAAVGARTLFVVPMLRDDELLGTITIYRQEVRLFTDQQIELVANFARQAVIAIENARLLKELRGRTDDLSASLQDLRTAQDRLVQTEKLASLGQLTAGIAHEIKNPLNFVNNFSALSAELVGEMSDVLAGADLDKKTRQELNELAQILKGNLEKVVQHGKRADSIVKNMLLHSREGSGEHRATDINALVEESLNLAYHGARAEMPGFEILLRRNFDTAAGMAEVYPQEITRALLNLISNGFYAATRRATEAGDDFKPVLTAATRSLGDKIEIRIHDNGIGIPAEAKAKIFNPFFTTKPSGEGTGLGLSMSHDIIVKQHGGSIDVETEPGLFTEFKIVLPRTNQR
jgi:two-component system, NtrC family, sensor kinase